MGNDRVEFLRQALEANPDDIFTRYALALDLANSGQDERAWQHFDYLLTHHPNYAPTYYQAGMLLLRLGRREEARTVFVKGVAVAGREANPHAQKHIQAALDMLGGGG
jgi:Flp pilus assembly protein TadD